MRCQLRHLAFLILIQTWFVCSGFAQSDSEAQARDRERVRLKIDLTDDDLRNLEHVGKLSMDIPKYFQNRVAAIQLRYVDTYSEERVRVIGEPAILSGASHLTVDSQLLERIRFQPVEVRVFEKNFTRVQINYEESSEPNFVTGDNEGFTELEYGIQVADRFLLKARIGLENKLSLASDIGKVQIDWNDIERLEFARGEELKATVDMKTGDKLSGLVDLSDLTIKTRWGLVTVPIGDISMILPTK